MEKAHHDDGQGCIGEWSAVPWMKTPRGPRLPAENKRAEYAAATKPRPKLVISDARIRIVSWTMRAGGSQRPVVLRTFRGLVAVNCFISRNFIVMFRRRSLLDRHSWLCDFAAAAVRGSALRFLNALRFLYEVLSLS
jgi:hypothetical protein